MKYEIDFIGVTEHTKDALASCFRWYNEKSNRYIVAVYDGGFQIHGDALVKHMNDYYFLDDPNPTIDIVICSHSDDDHAIGLIQLFDNFSVTNLIINRPWRFSEELFPLVYDNRKTKDSVEKDLREKYESISILEKKAIERGTKIYDGFTSLNFEECYSPLKILSPSKDMYLQLIVESTKTPYENVNINENALQRVFMTAKKIVENWSSDSLREDVSTTAENESSIVLYIDFEEEKLLLTGDAGIRALIAAADYSENINIDLRMVAVHQIPHHGGRHNVSSITLDRVLGSIVPYNYKSKKSAFVSVGKDSDHPREMVTNAYIRRGARVFEVRGSTICHNFGDMPKREGWNISNNKIFSLEVEDWN